VTQRYSMVNIPRAERGDTKKQLWSKGQGQTERGKRLEDQNTEVVQYMIINRKYKTKYRSGKLS